MTRKINWVNPRRHLEILESRHVLSAVPFADPVSLSLPSENYFVEDLRLVDLDGDEDLDLLQLRRVSKAISQAAWRFNDGVGNFGPEILQEFEATELRFVEMNGDGAIDILDSSTGNVVWFENRFSEAQGFSDEPRDAPLLSFLSIREVADLNQDGLDDLVYWRFCCELGRTTEILWAENLGSGNFRDHSLLTADQYGSLIIEDVDQDDDLDVVHIGETIQQVANSGAGEAVFAAPVGSAPSISRTKPEAVDVDDDGDLDLALIHWQGSERGVFWYENQNGNFNSATMLTDHGDLDDPPTRVLFQYDSNDDGEEEFVVQLNSGKYAWLDNLQSTVPQPFADHFPYLLFAEGDIDRDEDPELMASSVLGDNLVWFERLSQQDVENGQVILESDVVFPRRPELVDFDVDGDLDALVYSQGSLKWYENLQADLFGPAQVVTDDLPQKYQLLDVNADGRLDIAYVDAGRGLWLENLAGSFSEARELPGSRHDSWIDVDGDGDWDYFRQTPETTAVHRNDGRGNFVETLELDFVGESELLLATDIEGDGDQDLVRGATGPLAAITVEINQGDGTYQSRIARPATPQRPDGTKGGVQGFWLEDADQDGDQDLIVLNQTDNQVGPGGLRVVQPIEFWTNQANSFEPTYEVVINDRLALLDEDSIQFADLDGDLDRDLVAKGNLQTVYLENLSDAQTHGIKFQSPQFVQYEGSSARRLSEIAAGDLNGDGFADLLGTLINENRLVWFKNDSASDRLVVGPVTVDELYAAIDAGASDEAFDSNGDGFVNVEDIDFLLEEAGTVRGDANLDGKVDFADFLVLSANFGEERGWAGGNFNGDTVVDFVDFLLLSANFGFPKD